MNRSISRGEILDYLYRSKFCFEESKDESAKKYFLHCIMAVYNLAKKCDVLQEGDADFYYPLLRRDRMCADEYEIAQMCDFGGDE